MTMLQHAIFMLLLPLASAAVIALFLRQRGALASYLSVATAGVIAAIAPAVPVEIHEASAPCLRRNKAMIVADASGSRRTKMA